MKMWIYTYYHALYRLISLGCLIGCMTSALAQQTSKNLLVKAVDCQGTLEAKEVPALLDKYGIEFHSIDVVNWKKNDYRPEVAFRIAHTGNHFLLHYRVTEENVRAVASQDYGRVWDDACVEFFISPQADSCYYNIECNCIGKLLIQGGVAKTNRQRAPSTVMQEVKRWSSLGSEPFETRPGRTSWELTLIIPVQTFFLHDINTLHGRVMKANFYKCGNRLVTPHHLSWMPIDTPRPQFHTPQFFGTLYLE